MRAHAYGIRHLPTPPFLIPKAPLFLPIPYVAAISWRGSAEASGYGVERAEVAQGPWVVVGRNLSDADVPYRPLFADRTAQIGKSYDYRVIAKNESGRSSPSHLVGPVPVVYQALIDEMRDSTKVHGKKGTLTFRSGEDRKLKEDPHRLEGECGTKILYQAPGPILRVRVYAFSEQEGPPLSFFLGKIRDTFETADAFFRDYFRSGENYGYWRPLLYRIESPGSLPRFFQIRLNTLTQIGRIEIDYINP